MGKILRITMFKIPDPADQDKAIEAYSKVHSDNEKDSQKYILDLHAYKLLEDPRSQGYTVAAQTSFSSLEDMKYYDEECKAHGELKNVVKPLVKGGPPLMIYTSVE